MRLLMIWMGVTASGLLRICGGDATPPPAPPTAMPAPPFAPPAPVAMPAPPPAPLPAPPVDAVAVVPATTTPAVQPTLIARYGGNLLAVGSQGVELLPMTDGAVVAYVSDSAGNPLQGGAEMQVRLQGSDNAQHAVPLAWETQELRYGGRMDGSAQPVAGPVEVSLTQAGQTQTGRLDLAAVVEPPQHGGVVLVAGAQKAEVLAKADGVIQAYVTSSNGPVSDPALRVVARVQGADSTTHELPLAYDAAQGRYEGRAPDDWRIAPGPVEVAVGSPGGQEAVGRVEAVALLPPATRGGALVTAGSYGVEVLPRPDGQVEAYLCDAAATPIVADQGIELSVNIPTANQGAQPVTLIWDPVQARFVGRVVGARFNRGPVEVVVMSRGRRLRGRLASWAVAPIRTPVGTIPPPPVVTIPPPPVVAIPPPPVVRRPPPPPAVGVGVRPPGPPPPPPAVGVGVRGSGGRVEVNVGRPAGRVEVRPAKRPSKVEVNIRLGPR